MKLLISIMLFSCLATSCGEIKTEFNNKDILPSGVYFITDHKYIKYEGKQIHMASCFCKTAK